MEDDGDFEVDGDGDGDLDLEGDFDGEGDFDEEDLVVITTNPSDCDLKIFASA